MNRLKQNTKLNVLRGDTANLFWMALIQPKKKVNVLRVGKIIFFLALAILSIGLMLIFNVDIMS